MITLRSNSSLRQVLPSAVVFVLIFCVSLAPLSTVRLAAAEPATGAALPEVPPAEIGLSATGVRALDELMARYTAPDRFPAAMLLVARGGRIGYWRAFGVRDLVRGDRLERNDVFRIHSLTKPVTAVAVLMLWEEGKLEFDDPVSRYVPAFGKVGVYAEDGRMRPARQPLTIRHLLTFTAGMSYGEGLGRPTSADTVIEKARPFDLATDLDDLMRRLSELPLVGDPGTFSYGPQTDVLGKVIEVASGRPLDRFFHERIFRPLGMAETGFLAPRSAVNRLLSYYSVAPGRAPELIDPGDATSEQVKLHRERRDWRFLSAGGGLVSTPADYIRFAQMLANRGVLDGVRLLRATTVDLMHASHVRTDSPRMSDVQGPGWAAGFQVMTAPDIAAAGGGGHDGLYWMSGYANLYMWVDPTSDLVALVWAQAAPYRVYPLFDDARRAVAAALDGSPGGRGPVLTAAESQEIVAAVTAGMKSYAAALGSVQADRIAAHYVEGPEFRLTSDGTVYSRAALQEIFTGLAKLSKIELTWESITVTPLGSEAALAVAPFRRVDFARDGTVSRNRGVASWVWVRRDGRWRMLYGHGDHYPDAP